MKSSLILKLEKKSLLSALLLHLCSGTEQILSMNANLHTHPSVLTESLDHRDGISLNFIHFSGTYRIRYSTKSVEFNWVHHVLLLFFSNQSPALAPSVPSSSHLPSPLLLLSSSSVYNSSLHLDTQTGTSAYLFQHSPFLVLDSPFFTPSLTQIKNYPG